MEGARRLARNSKTYAPVDSGEISVRFDNIFLFEYKFLVADSYGFVDHLYGFYCETSFRDVVAVVVTGGRRRQNVLNHLESSLIRSFVVRCCVCC